MAGDAPTIPTGRVGVEDACSGIRSLTACLFAGSFLSAIFLETLWKKITLVGAAMCLAFMTNLGRSLFLTAWAYGYGPSAIEGTVPDVAGYAVMSNPVHVIVRMVRKYRTGTVFISHKPYSEL